MATIKDVARQAGVSISTVSHVLNGTRFVSEDKAYRVRQAVEALNYKPSAVARSLKTNKTYTIGMLTGSNANPFFAEVIHGVEATCYERGYHLVLCNSDDNLDKQASYLQTLEEKRIDGLLVMSAHSDPGFFEMLREHCQWPLVILDCQAPGMEADVIMEDPEQGGYEATRHLLDNGHRSIACISGPADLSPSSQRLAGYHRALEESGIPAENGWIVEGRLTAESGFEAVNRLLDGLDNGQQPPSALFVGNDLMAMGVICALQTRGYRIPDDISVIGYDDIELASYTSPPLTTIHQPKAELGRLAADTLITRIENPGQKPEVKTLRSTLVERQSVKTTM
ncbi:MAG: LacI family DNA-binding transcriptional regulator [Endozoicomonas sp.]|uniref:LacI family DNA-binding transcriptional regulator n=1 Tax=Endozoicomonas sp. TaxID=1892382 RepID=UPI003D9AF53E